MAVLSDIADKSDAVFIASNPESEFLTRKLLKGTQVRKEKIMSANILPAPTLSISEKDQIEIQDIYQKIRTADARLVGPDGKTQILPSTLYSFLCTVLADLKAGYSVTLLQSNASLTTVEASKLLGVS